MGNYCTKNNNITLETANSSIPKYSLNNEYLSGKVVYIYDGDTVHIVFKINNKLTKFNCRLLSIDSPEICPKNINDLAKRNEEIESAIKSRNFLINQVTNIPIINTKMTKNEIKELCSKSTKLIWVKCFDFDKYGRLLVELYNSKDVQISINQLILDNKYAVKYDGGTKKEYSHDNFN
jgi:endonuclease YncB( thermonuclease family)